MPDPDITSGTTIYRLIRDVQDAHHHRAEVHIAAETHITGSAHASLSWDRPCRLASCARCLTTPRYVLAFARHDHQSAG